MIHVERLRCAYGSVVSVTASLIPAIRAARVEPMRALREE
jgi:ABC-type lipoprotein release transport system permease subunit